MEQIFEPNDTFNFNNLILSPPISIISGNYFIKFIVNNSKLYIQPPKCKTKQGIIKTGKRIYTDLIFSNDDDNFIRWMENLESYCHEYIFKNKLEWFDGELEQHEIENYFTSPIKIYKSGKFYTIRTNISTILGKSTLKIYNEDENQIEIDDINDNMDLMTILEIQGIKCSARSFQIDIELKQMMILKPNNLFEKCLIKTNINNNEIIKEQDNIKDYNKQNIININNLENHISNDLENTIKEQNINYNLDNNINKSTDNLIIDKLEENTNNNNNILIDKLEETSIPNLEINNDLLINKIDNITNLNELEEINLNLDEIKDLNIFKIKKKNDVYYQMYRDAQNKAKIARDLALSSFLEAKRIKNTYMLDDINDFDDSDLEQDNELLI